MKVKDHIRQDVSQVFNILIPENKWQEYMDLLDRDGHPTRRELVALVLVFGKHIEKLEGMVEDLYFQQELLEGNKVDNPFAKMPEFKLRTPIDIQLELDAIQNPNTTKFYLSDEDWKLLEKAVVKPDLAKTQPEHGYGKEIDPKDGQEKICIFYHNLPVFKK